MSNFETQLTKAAVRSHQVRLRFIDIMDDHMARQEEHGYDPQQGLYNLYEELVFLYEQAKEND